MAKLNNCCNSDSIEQISLGLAGLLVLASSFVTVIAVIDLVTRISGPLLQIVLGWRWS
jgi:hypothetical protein